MRDPSVPAPLPDLTLRRVAVVAALAALGCGASRPEPVRVDPPEVALETVRAGESLSDLERLEPVAPPIPVRPWLPMGVRWSPAEPREGDAVALRLSRPTGGRPPLDVRAEIDGRPVHFVRVGGDWFGIASVPIGTSGTAELVLEFGLGPDSTVVQHVPLETAAREFPATRLSVAPRYSDPSPEALERIRGERRRISAALSSVTERWLPDGPFAAPRDARTTSPFGQRRLFNDELQSRHTGLDLAGRPGDPVRASARGEVALADDLYFAGRAVYLDHGLGVFTGYFHLSEIEVEPGEVVERGELVGRVGSSGRVTGPHLHWSLYVGGESLDAGSLLRMDVPRAEAAHAGTPGSEAASGAAAGEETAGPSSAPTTGGR